MKLVPRAVVAVSSLFLGVSAVGCRDGGSEEPEPDGPPALQESKIQDVHKAEMAEGTKLKLEGVIVTAIDKQMGPGNSYGRFFVQEPEGGPFSGVLVFGAKFSEVDKLAVGDVVNLEGLEKDEFLPENDATSRTITEVRNVRGGAITITVVSKGQAVTPATVDIAALSAMPLAQAEVEMEKWEGVLITIKNVPQLNDPRPASSAVNTTFFDFTLQGGLIVDTSHTDFPATSVAGACYSSITGIGDYFYNYKIVPRSAADFTFGAATDCAAPKVTTITEAQAGTYPKLGLQPNLVLLRDAIVTAITVSTDEERKNFKSFWVSASHDAAADEGVQIFMGGTPISADLAVGSTVDVLGTVIEFDNSGSTGDKLTEINRPAVKIKEPPSATAVTALSSVGLATIASIADGEPYEGVLLQLTNLKITAIGDKGDFVTVTDLTGATITVDDDIYDYAAADLPLNTCYSSITGIASLNTFDNKRTFLPRTAADLVVDPTGAACTPP